MVFLGGFFLVGGQDNQAFACTVLTANFRTIPAQISTTTWYTDTNSPYVYIDITTNGCDSGDTFNLSVTEIDGTETYSLFPGFLNDLTFHDNVGAFNALTIQVGNNTDFTVAAISGDEHCDPIINWLPTDCVYVIRVNDDVNYSTNPTCLIWGDCGTTLGGGTLATTQTLRYNCHNGCDNKNWSYIGIIDYGAVHPQDPSNSSDSGSGIQSGPTAININIPNPLGDQNMTLVSFIEKIIKFAITVGIPIVAIAIIYSGLLFVTARGDEKQLETARNAFTYAVIGGAVLLGSFIFAKLIKETIETIAMISNYFV